MALSRHGKIIANPDGELNLYFEDILFILGKNERVTMLDEIFYNQKQV